MKLVMAIEALIIIVPQLDVKKPLKTIIQYATLNASIIIVQHTPKFINETLREYLDNCTSINVRIAENNDFIEKGKYTSHQVNYI